jgi:hypothetical protein
MIDRYLPVPVWNNRVGHWDPVDFQHGQHVAAWPNGFDIARLPLPDYRDGDRVQFVRDETCAREGVVRMVLLREGGTAHWTASRSSSSSGFVIQRTWSTL